jgi:hypothetical protein
VSAIKPKATNPESVAFLSISHPKKRAFLAAFSRYGSRIKAAKLAKVDRRTHYNWLKDDTDYREAFAQAEIEAADSLEDAMTDMAFDGNVTAAIFLLKGLRPEKYRERSEVKVPGLANVADRLAAGRQRVAAQREEA